MTTLGPINNESANTPILNKSSITGAKQANPTLVSQVKKEQAIDLGKLFLKLTPEELKDYIKILSKKTGLDPEVIKESLLEESARYTRDQETLPLTSKPKDPFEQFRDRETIPIPPPKPENKNDPLQGILNEIEDQRNASLLTPSAKEQQKQANLQKLYDVTKAFINSKDEPNKALQNKVKTASAISLTA